MYAHINREQRAATRVILVAIIGQFLLWSLAAMLVVAVLTTSLAVLLDIDPVTYVLHSLVKAAIPLSGLAVNLLAGCFLAAAIGFGIEQRLPELLQHQPLNGGVIARFTQSVVIWTSSQADVATLFAGQCCWQTALTRPSRIALCTASDLAGSTPRLE